MQFLKMLLRIQSLQIPTDDPLSLIDSSIEAILHYFSASNWSETYSIVYSRLQSTIQSIHHSDSDIIPGLELYGILHLDAFRAEKVLSDLYAYIQK